MVDALFLAVTSTAFYLTDAAPPSPIPTCCVNSKFLLMNSSAVLGTAGGLRSAHLAGLFVRPADSIYGHLHGH
jgi:hypothetical protein